jgi:hypothetical protein
LLDLLPVNIVELALVVSRCPLLLLRNRRKLRFRLRVSGGDSLLVGLLRCGAFRVGLLLVLPRLGAQILFLAGRVLSRLLLLLLDILLFTVVRQFLGIARSCN